MKQLKAAMATLAIFSGALPASAHAGFILPDAFAYKSCSGLGAIATFSDYFPSPEIVLTAPDFRLIGPAGEVAFDRVSADHAMTRLEASLDVPGSYRITTGERLGRKGKVTVQDGRYVRLEGDETLPEGTPVLTSQTATVSDTYFTCGGNTTAIDTAAAGRLAIIPEADDGPAAQRRSFRVTFEGAAIEPEEAYLIPAYSAYGGAHEGEAVTFSKPGTLTLEDLAPGIYLLLVRHIAPSPETAETDVRSYSTTLTFAVGSPHETPAD